MLRRAIACMVATTTAAPVMSLFMSSIEALGLRLRPPESKVTPFRQARMKAYPRHGDNRGSRRTGGFLNPRPPRASRRTAPGGFGSHPRPGQPFPRPRPRYGPARPADAGTSLMGECWLDRGRD